uniref:Uncharacterized protein n=1 Tax=Plectus sambesii TaxID=2011161 RepID=A0A914XFH2_9BILA
MAPLFLLSFVFVFILPVLVISEENMPKIGYFGHPDTMSNEWIDEELKKDVPSDKALTACCNVENDGIWMNACTMWDREDSWCRYQNKCWSLLRRFAYASYTKEPKAMYQMVQDAAENVHKVSDFLNCSRAEYRH